MKWMVAFAALAAGAGAWAQEVQDTDEVDTQAAYIALVPRLSFKAGGDARLVDLNLICVDAARKSRSVYLPRNPNGQPIVAKVPPGACYLGTVRSGSVSATFHPSITVFAAYPAQVSYAGDWEVVIAPSVEVTVGVSALDRSETMARAHQGVGSVAAIKAAYPRLTSALPIEFTGPATK